ncbi:MAG: sugar ABC transporter permease [Candidatus Caldatribacterium sp.]|nr:sugar ABC transporter permease [Candidatus Caldatribacterium sp.]
MSGIKRVKGWFYVAPAVVLLFFLTVYPFAYSVYLSFFDVKGWSLRNISFCGFSNYLKVLSDPLFRGSLRFTSMYTVSALLIEFLLGLIIAFLVNEITESKFARFTKLITILILLPILLPGVATATMFSLMLNDVIGAIPNALKATLGFRVSFLSKPLSATVSLLAVDVWQWTSFFFLLIYAGLRMLPRETIEAARIEGAGETLILRKIILPQLRFVIIVALVLRGIWLFRSFDIPRLLTAGGPGIATRTVSLQIYEYSFKQGLLGVAAAATVIVLVIVNVVVLAYFRFQEGRE